MLAQINWKPSHPDLRKFGLTLLIGFAILGGIVFLFGKTEIAKWMWIGGGSVGLLALVLPGLSRPFYMLWMGLAFVMGTIISFLIVFFIFYFIITPVGLFMKLIGRDALYLKKKSFKDGTYWHTHPPLDDKDYYSRLY